MIGMGRLEGARGAQDSDVIERPTDDLKADRHASELLVRGAYAEPHADRGAVSEAVASELALMADWLELGSVKVEKRGDLAVQLARAL